MKTILVCTTFREFNGNSNDQIQRLFLKSLYNQEYKNWKLIVTVFNEKNVEKVLNELKIPHRIYYNPSNEYKFSFTKVLLNGIKSIEDYGKNVVLWTTCDVIFESNFFGNIISHFSELYCGTSHPHIRYSTIDKYKQNQHLHIDPTFGMDTLFFDADIFLDEKSKDMIKKYENKGWGLYEHFLVGVGQLFSKMMINLWYENKIHKIINDPQADNKIKHNPIQPAHSNRPVFSQFIKDQGLSNKLFDLFYCHRQFKPTHKFNHYITFYKYYCKAFFQTSLRYSKIITSRLKRAVGFNK